MWMRNRPHDVSAEGSVFLQPGEVGVARQFCGISSVVVPIRRRRARLLNCVDQ